MRDNWLRLFIGLLIVGLGLWLASATEWVEIEVPTQPKGEAATNELYATQRLVRGLGGEVVVPGGLHKMPPPRATLVLSSWNWAMFPQRAQQLRQWVEQGGHLVIDRGMLHNAELSAWVPVRVRGDEEDEDDPPADADEGVEDDKNGDKKPAKPAGAASAPRWALPKELPCAELSEPESVPASYADGKRSFQLCAHERSFTELVSGQPSLWSLDASSGPVMLRAAVGQGSVTVVGPWGFFENDRVMKGDNALVIVSILQARRGAQVWFVSEEDRLSFMRWLWQQAWVVLLLGALALVLALWRGAVRFGPLAKVRALGRRSMAEQITGTAQFLSRHGGPALHAAQLRALDLAATAHLRGYARMERSARAQALARATGLDATALGQALERGVPRRRIDWPPVLELLETARRLLIQSRKH